jgi:hypothetical protein
VDTGVRDGQTTLVDMSGASAELNGFSQWGREQLLLRDGETPQANIALRLAWEAGTTPDYAITLPTPAIRDWTLSDSQALTFALSCADDEPRPIEVWVELETAGGSTVRLPLSQFGAIHPPLPARILKADWVKTVLGFDKINVETPYERVLQSYVLPLSAFQVADPVFQPDQLTALRFIFDAEQGGAVYLDHIGFMNAAD